MNHICIHALETQNSLVDEDWRLRLPSQYGMTFTLLACESPPSSYEAKPAVCVGQSVNFNACTPRTCIDISGQVRLKFNINLGLR